MTGTAEARRLPSWLRVLVTVCGVESGLALAYLLGTDAGLAAPASLAVPFVWLTVAATAVWVVDVPRVPRRVWLGAAVAGGSYTLALAWLTGVVSLSSGAATGLDLLLLPPGWGPALGWDGPVVAARLLPYRVAGYLALGYLVAVAVADAAGPGDRVCSAAGGVVALSSCAGCSLPLVSWLVGGLGSVALTGSVGVGPATYLLATGSYLVAVGALVWRGRIATAADRFRRSFGGGETPR